MDIEMFSWPWWQLAGTLAVKIAFAIALFVAVGFLDEVRRMIKRSSADREPIGEPSVWRGAREFLAWLEDQGLGPLSAMRKDDLEKAQKRWMRETEAGQALEASLYKLRQEPTNAPAV